MKIERLNWDSDFFNLKVGRILINRHTTSSDYTQILQSDELQHFDVIYIFSSFEILNPENLNIVLYDKKVTYQYRITNVDMCPVDNNIKECYESDMYLRELALRAGHKSRFNLDPHFKSQHFERLYEAWLSNSISGKIADKVYAYCLDGKPVGLITVGLNEEKEGHIGLIAVHPSYCHQGIASKLIAAAKNYCHEKGGIVLNVVTQKYNLDACNLYEQNGFKIIKEEFIYHKWNNN